MKTELEPLLTATLHARADSDVDPGPMLRLAVAKGRRLRWRRRIAAAGAALATLAGAAIVQIVPATLSTPAAGSWLPDAPGSQGALSRPDLVGTEPHVLHFAADALTRTAEHVEAAAGGGSESLTFSGPDGDARIVVAQTPADLQSDSAVTVYAPYRGDLVEIRGGEAVVGVVDGGTGRMWWAVWTPVKGLHVQYEGSATDRADLLAKIASIRLDTARRCAVPFELGAVPLDGTVQRCQVRLGPGGVYAAGALTIGDGLRALHVRVERVDAASGRFDAPGGDVVAGPYRAKWQGSTVLSAAIEPTLVEIRLSGGGYSQFEAESVLEGYRPVGDLDRPDTW
jgi:hypothetical protein